MCIDDLDIVCGMDMGYVSESVRVCVCVKSYSLTYLQVYRILIDEYGIRYTV